MARHRGFSVPVKKNGPPASPGPNVGRTRTWPRPLCGYHTVWVCGPGARGKGPGGSRNGNSGAMGVLSEGPGPRPKNAPPPLRGDKCKLRFAQAPQRSGAPGVAPERQLGT